MEKYTYKTNGVCAREISFELDGDIVHNISFVGGCQGNLHALSVLAEGMTIAEIIEKCSAITCGAKSTSCAHQLTEALRLGGGAQSPRSRSAEE